MSDQHLAEKYHGLISDFLAGRISASEFETRYLDEFKNEPGGVMSDVLYLILEDMFENVDRYWHECTPDQETDFEISEPTLRKYAQEALQYLKDYLQGRPVDVSKLKERVTIWWENIHPPAP
jgi:hypothetical protein